jgi:hypothetical protein
MLGNRDFHKVTLLRIVPPWLVALLWLLFCSPVSAGGLDWGGGGGDTGGTPGCTPDDPLVIMPGPLGSPVRIAAFDAHTYLVADYTRKTLSWFDSSGILSPFLETLGKPLSVAINARFKKNGKLREAYYFVGNDDDRTIDVYYEKNDQFSLAGQYPVGDNGIQALDMVFDQTQDQLFVVDGLAREINVLQPDGQLVRRFGAGVLSDPKGIAIDTATGEIYVSDYGDPVVFPVIPASIKVFDMTGSHLSDRKISGSGLFSRPQGLSLLGDKVYLADNMLAQILEFDRATGTKTSSFGCKGSSAGHLLLPMDVALADGQNLFVADNRNMRVTVLPLMQP